MSTQGVPTGISLRNNVGHMNPGLICNFVWGTRKTNETTLLSTPIFCSESSSVGVISTQRGQVKSRLTPGGPCSSES